MKGTILVGTAGQGILRSIDDGATWHRLGLKEAIEFDGVVRSLAIDPQDPSRVFAGADCGLCVSTDGGAAFTRIDSVLNGLTVWAMAFNPKNPSVMYAGTGAPSRAKMFRSTDCGKSWTDLGMELPEFCKGVNRPRILSITVNPLDDREVLFAVEEGGLFLSGDAGESWRRVDTPDSKISNSDIHAVVILPPTDGHPLKYIVLTVNSVFESTDGGRTWSGKASKDRFDDMYYTRTIAIDPTGTRLLLAIGDGTPGTRSTIYRSEDRGVTWVPAIAHTAPNSCVWAFAGHPSDSTLVFAGTKYGHLLRSQDGGRSWHKEWREFSEITSLAWTPFVAPVTAHPQSIA